MKLLINDKEIWQYLCTLIDNTDYVNDIEFSHFRIAEAIEWSKERSENPKFREKIKARIYKAVLEDTKEYVDKIKTVLENRNETYSFKLRNNMDYVIEKLGIDNIFEQYNTSKKNNFVKSVGKQIDSNAQFVRRKSYIPSNDDCLLRNTTGNENILVSKIDNSLPFWFIDSGYTNFLEGKNKKWHRLVRNHLHSNKSFNAPVDRLGMFKSFPQPWRTDGDKILVIEPGSFAAAIFHYDIKQWKYDVESELRKYTDKKIVFREKAPKKQRDPLYKHLCDNDYYCVININSNAATEAIWAGIPVITMDRHITNSVSKNSLSEINNLYRGPLGDWLAILSYSQFTYDELINGAAVNIVKKYHV